MEVSASWVYRRSALTALKSNHYSGYAIVTHPFHPLKGQHFKILSVKTYNQRDILSLESDKGAFAILREWTNHADPQPYSILRGSYPILSFPHLQQLADLIKQLPEPNHQVTD